MGFKVLYRLDFTVGGYGGGNLLAQCFLSADCNHSTTHLPAGKEQERKNRSRCNQQQVVSFQETAFLFPYHREDFFSINNPIARAAQIPVPACTGLEMLF